MHILYRVYYRITTYTSAIVTFTIAVDISLPITSLTCFIASKIRYFQALEFNEAVRAVIYLDFKRLYGLEREWGSEVLDVR